MYLSGNPLHSAYVDKNSIRAADDTRHSQISVKALLGHRKLQIG
jgi:hypothetical protein